MYLLKLYNMYLAQLVVGSRRRAQKLCSTVGLYWNTKLQFCQYKFRQCTSQNITGLSVQDGNLVSCSLTLTFSSELQYICCCNEQRVYRSAPTWCYNKSVSCKTCDTNNNEKSESSSVLPTMEGEIPWDWRPRSRWYATGVCARFVQAVCISKSSGPMNTEYYSSQLL